jgi:hypothetical protein
MVAVTMPAQNPLIFIQNPNEMFAIMQNLFALLRMIVFDEDHICSVYAGVLS